MNIPRKKTRNTHIATFVPLYPTSTILPVCSRSFLSPNLQGGVLTLSSGDSCNKPGGKVVMRNSSFESNAADRGSGGVMYLGDFATAVVEGDANVFKGNKCFGDGGVFAATTNTSLTIEGGLFIDNRIEEVGHGIF